MAAPTPLRLPYPRAARLRAPLLLSLWVLLAFEAIGGLVIFVARLIYGILPGESVHLAAGLALIGIYVVYQWRHWMRVRPFVPRLDYSIGLVAAIFMALTNVTGLLLGVAWWRARFGTPGGVEAAYPPPLSACHNIGSMVVLTFVGAHLGAVLMRDRRIGR